MIILDLACAWLEKTGRIKDPARGSPERKELVAAFRLFITNASSPTKKG